MFVSVFQLCLCPCFSLLLGWWLQDLGAGVTLEDTLVAVRAGWMQRSCADLYPRCHAVRGTEPPPPYSLLTTPTAAAATAAAASTTTTPASATDTKTTPPHGFFWALSSLLKNPVPRPKKPFQRPPPPTLPPPLTSTTTTLPPEIVGRLPPAPTEGEEPLAALEGLDHVPEVDWGGAPPVEPAQEQGVEPDWERHQAVAWNRVDLGGSGGPPWDEFGGHGGKSPRGRPREVAGATISYQRPGRRQELWQDQQQELWQDQQSERPPGQPAEPVTEYVPEHQPDQWPERTPEQQQLEQQPDLGADHRPDLMPDLRPDHRPDLRPDQRLDLGQDKQPDQRPEHQSDHRPDQGEHQPVDQDGSASAPEDQETAAASADPYQGGHLIPGSLSGGGRLPGALLALRRRPGRPYRPSRRGYVGEYGSDVLSGVQQSYASGGAAPTEAAPTTFRPGLVLDAPPPVREQQHQQQQQQQSPQQQQHQQQPAQQLLPGRYRLGLRRGLPGGAQGVLPAYAEPRRGLSLIPPVPPAVSPAPRHRWLPSPPTAAPPGVKRHRTWVQFGPQDGVTDADRHRNLFSYVRDRSVRRLWARSS